jgi:hypothetical protein
VASDDEVNVKFGASADELHKVLGGVKDRFADTFKETGNLTDSLTSSVGKLGPALAIMTAAFAAFEGAKILTESAIAASEYGNEISKSAQKTGIAADTLQELHFAALMSDVSVASLEGGIKKLQVAMEGAAKDGSAQADAFRAVGISAEELKGMKTDEVLSKLAEAFKGSSDGASKTAVAMQLLGRGGIELIPFLNQGAKGMEEMKDKAHELGFVMGGDAIAQANALDDALKEMHIHSQANAHAMGGAFMPAVLNLAKGWNMLAGNGEILIGVSSALGWVVDSLTWGLSYLTEGLTIMAKVAVGASVSLGLAATGNFKMAGQAIIDMGDDVVKTTEKYEKFREELETPPKEQKASITDAPKKKITVVTGSEELTKWQRELEDMRAKDRKDNGILHELSKQAEIDFWTEKGEIAKTIDKKTINDVSKLRVEAEIALAKGVYAEQMAQLQAKLVGAKGHADKEVQIQTEMFNLTKKYFTDETKTYEDEQRKQEVFAKAHADALVKINIETAANTSEISKIKLDQEKEGNQFLLDSRKITQEQLLQMNAAADNAQRKNERDLLLYKMSLYDVDEDEYRKLKDSLAQLDAKHTKDVVAQEHAAALESGKVWREYFKSFHDSIDKALTEMIMGTKSFREAVNAVGKQMLTELVSIGVKATTQWLVQEAVKLTATKAKDTAIIASGATTAGAGTALNATTATVEITNNAAVAGAGITAQSAPYTGWGAVALGAAGMATVLALLGGIKSSAGGEWRVGSDRLNMVHKDETILPASIATPLRDSVENGGGLGGGGVNINVSAIDAKGVKQFFDTHGSSIADSLMKQRRDFKGGFA